MPSGGHSGLAGGCIDIPLLEDWGSERRRAFPCDCCVWTTAVDDASGKQLHQGVFGLPHVCEWCVW